MIEMVDPHGRLLNVPEDQVDQALGLGATIKNQSSRGLGASALRQVGRTGRAIATGIAGLADIPNLGAMGLHAAGLKETPTFYEPVAGKVQQGIDTLTGGALKPENKVEEYIDIGSEGLAPMALAPFTGGASLTGTAARGLSKAGIKGAEKLANVGARTYAPTAANIAGSVGSSAALKTYLDEGGDPGIIGALLAGTAGGAAGRGALKLKNPLNTAANIAGTLTRFSPKKYAQQTKMGLPVSLGSVSTGEIPGWLEMIAEKSLPSMRTMEKFNKRRERAIARNLGVSTPEDLVGAVEHVPMHLAKRGGTGYYNRITNIFERRKKKFEPRIEESIKNKETTEIGDLVSKLENKRERYVSSAAKIDWDKTPDGILLKKLKSYSPSSEIQAEANLMRKELQGMKTPDGKSIPENIINEIIESNLGEVPIKDTKFYSKRLDDYGKSISPVSIIQPGEVPIKDKRIGYEDLNLLREKALDESKTLKAPLGEGTTESAKASMRYGELSKQRKKFIEEIGNPTEIHNARQAHKFWSKYKNEDHGMAKYVGKITGADNDANAFKKLIDGDEPRLLSIARQGLDRKSREELGQGIINSLGSRQGRWNINTFHTNFLKKNKQWKQEAYKTAFTSKAAKENFLRTMDFVGHNKRLIEKLSNSSNTAHTNNLFHLGRQLGTAVAGAVTGHGVLGLLAVGLEVGSLWGGSKIWTSQKFLKRVNDVMTAKTVSGKAHKLDVLYNSINQLGRQSHYLDKE